MLETRNSVMPGVEEEGPLFAGLDVSTQSCKLVVIDPAAGAVVRVDQVDYDRDLPDHGTVEGVIPGLGEGVSESDPRMWIEAVDLTLDRLRNTDVQAGRIRCISVSGQQHGLVALAADGGFARPRSKLWNDFSTAEECRLLTEAVGGPAGVVAVMEPGDASGMALWHSGTRQWSLRVMDAIDVALSEKLPSVEPADGAVGTGNIEPGIVTVSLGTSGTAYTFLQKPFIDPTGEIAAFQPKALCRAVLEGHVLNLYDGFARMPVSPREIRLTGGLSRSPAWCQTMADIFQAETVPVGGEGAALGAAIHAAWVWKKEEGKGRPLKEVADPFIVLDEERRARPRPGRPADLRSAAPPLPGPQPENPGAGRRGPLSLEAGVA